MLGVIWIILGIAAALCLVLKQENNEWQEVKSLEIFQTNAILAYCGTASVVQISAQFEKDVDDDKPEIDVSLISITCDKLALDEHLWNVSISNLPFSTARPVFFPPGYNHYELQSSFCFEISIMGPTNTSKLTMRIFNNTVDADAYTTHPTDVSAQNKAVLTEHVFEEDMSRRIPFDPSYASYFIPTVVAEGGTLMNISYYVKQTYYNSADYNIDVYQDHCQLNSTATPCKLKRASNETEMCVLARYPPTTRANAPRILLLVSTKKHESTYTFPRHIVFSISLSVLFALLFIACLVFFLCLIRRCKKPPEDYSQLAMGVCTNDIP